MCHVGHPQYGRCIFRTSEADHILVLVACYACCEEHVQFRHGISPDVHCVWLYLNAVKVLFNYQRSAAVVDGYVACRLYLVHDASQALLVGCYTLTYGLRAQVALTFLCHAGILGIHAALLCQHAGTFGIYTALLILFASRLCAFTLVFSLFADILLVVEAGKKMGKEIICGPVYSSDVFYDESKNSVALRKLGVLAVEMEAASLYLTAARAGKNALCICTISDNVVTGECMPAEQRQVSFREMMKIALEIA